MFNWQKRVVPVAGSPPPVVASGVPVAIPLEAPTVATPASLTESRFRLFSKPPPPDAEVSPLATVSTMTDSDDQIMKIAKKNYKDYITEEMNGDISWDGEYYAPIKEDIITLRLQKWSPTEAEITRAWTEFMSGRREEE
jgi:hypothetical protein